MNGLDVSDEEMMSNNLVSNVTNHLFPPTCNHYYFNQT